MASIQEMLARKRAELAASGGTQVGGTQVGSSSTPTATAEAPAEAPAQEQPAQPTTVGALLAKFKAASSAAQPAPVPAQPAVKPREYPVPYGTPEFEADHTDLCEATRALDAALAEDHSGIRYWLDRVHEQLRQEPELVHMLNDDQTSALYAGFIARSGMVIVPEKAKPKPKAKAAKPKLSEDDM